MDNIKEEYVRRLYLAISKINGMYYWLEKKSGVKENTLVLIYVLDLCS